MIILKIMGLSLSCTIILEIVTALILGIRNKLDLLNVFLVNVLTNPFVVSLSYFVNIRYGLSCRNIVLIILEISVVIIEGLIYKKYLDYKKINPILVSLILNCSSYFIGEIINRIVW